MAAMMLTHSRCISRPPAGQALRNPPRPHGRSWRELPVNRIGPFVRKSLSLKPQQQPQQPRRVGVARGSLGRGGGGDSEGGGGGVEKVVSSSGEEAIRGDGEQRASEDATGKLLTAVGLILGTAVGPGILGLPAATLSLGVPVSSAMILGAGAYVAASVLLVAELSCAVMAETRQKEVSFTSLVIHTLGPMGAGVVALVYASMNYALLVACISGLGTIVQAWLTLWSLPLPLLSTASAAIFAGLVAFAPFEVVDGVNRALCGLLIAAISSLVFVGFYAGRGMWGTNQAFRRAASLSSVLPAVPLTILTLGFHVITPVVCGVVGGKPEDARKAILVGGAIPLGMVLTWNAVILGLAPPHSTSVDPIRLLLSLSDSAGPAVQAFAFAALGTTLLGYALSFPKQLGDALQLFRQKFAAEGAEMPATETSDRQYLEALAWALAPPTAVAAFCPQAFASALDFAGVYANCFLFGLLPPVMAWSYRYRQTTEVSAFSRRGRQLLPGGKVPLLLLFGTSILLGIGAG